MTHPDIPPRLKRISLRPEKVKGWDAYPFTLPVVRSFKEIELTSRLCFLVGENGTGKSTLLEAIADHCGFSPEGGSRHFGLRSTETSRSVEALSDALRLSWSKKLTSGFFLRAESFFNAATYLDELGPEALDPYGGKSLHEQSHGESFLALVENRFFRRGIYLLDEPEAALSPQRQLSLLLVLNRLLRNNLDIQFIISTHSPILLSYPGSQILSLDGGTLREVRYKDTEPYKLVRGFLENPEAYLRQLFAELPLEE